MTIDTPIDYLRSDDLSRSSDYGYFHKIAKAIDCPGLPIHGALRSSFGERQVFGGGHSGDVSTASAS